MEDKPAELYLPNSVLKERAEKDLAERRRKADRAASRERVRGTLTVCYLCQSGPHMGPVTLYRASSSGKEKLYVCSACRKVEQKHV